MQISLCSDHYIIYFIHWTSTLKSSFVLLAVLYSCYRYLVAGIYVHQLKLRCSYVMRININDCDKHSLSYWIYSIRYLVCCLLSQLRNWEQTVNWGSPGELQRDRVKFIPFSVVWKTKYSSKQFLTLSLYSKITWKAYSRVLTQVKEMRLTYNLPSSDCWTEKVGLHLPGVTRTGYIAQLYFPKRQGGVELMRSD